MLKDIEEFPEGPLPESDVCIIGTGPAGLDLALSFANTQYSVTLIEGGHVDFDWKDQNLSQYITTGREILKPNKNLDPSKPYNFDQVKGTIPHIRQYGGAYKLWDGIWKSFDPSDFHDKPYSTLPSWPISIRELSKFYKYIANDYFLKDLLSFKKFLHDESTGLITDLPSLRPVALYQIEPRLAYEGRFLNAFKGLDHIKLIVGANAIKLEPSEDGAHINSVIVRSLSKKDHRLKARYYILCAGAVGNARLLLYSNIGNSNDLVGRNLICSPNGLAGVLIPFTSNLRLPRLTFRGHKRYRVGVALHSKFLEKHQIPNHCCLLEKPRYKKKPATIETIAQFMRFHLEQTPNRESRVELSDKVDDIGVPIPSLNWRFTNHDVVAFRKYVEYLTKLFFDQRIGRVLITEDKMSMNFLTASQFVGTTRMGTTPKEGVVDPDCKVFGLDNLYIGGASVIPTSGTVNPLFTILALSRRLSSHLICKMRAE